jgi:hypothetical protein
MWFYVRRVLVPFQRADAAAHDAPRGNLSDLYPRWLGARELLLNHRNPYSPEITREIQRGYYGRELDPRRPGDPIDEQAFAYPVYVTFLLAPTVWIPFEELRVGFEWFLIAITAASVWLWFQTIGWSTSTATVTLVAFLVLGSFPVVQGLTLQQLTLLVAFLVALGAALLARGHLFLAGVVLSIATIKPQLVSLLLLCLLVWTAGKWAERKRFVWGFAVTMAMLVGASEVILPGWLSNFRAALHDYRRYAGTQSVLDTLLSQSAGPIFSAVAMAVLLVLWWRFRRVQAQSREFQYLLAGVLVITLLVIPKVSPYNQVLLLPATLLIAREGRELWRRSLPSRAACVLTIITVGWPWVASLGLLIASIWLSPDRLENGWAIPLYTSLATPIVLLIQVGSLVLGAWRSQAPPAAVAKAAVNRV